MTFYFKERETKIFNRQFSILENCEVFAPVILDIGANIGQSVELYRHMSPDCTIHCFEPNPKAFESLVVFCGNIPNIILNNMAMTNYRGNSFFYSAQLSELSSLLIPEPFLKSLSIDDKYSTSKINVPCTTIDIYCDELKINHIDVLKIDVQGGEISVLNGALRMLSQAKVGLIYLEVIFAETYVGQTTLVDILTLLDSFRYRLWDLVPFTYTSAGAAWAANALFVCPQWAKHVEEKSRQAIANKPRA